MKRVLFYLSISILFTSNTYKIQQQGQPVESPAIWNGDRCNGLEIYRKLAAYKRGEINWEQFKSFEKQERKWITDNCFPQTAISCVDRKLQMNQEGDYWVFYIVEYNKKCKPLKNPKEVFRIKAPEDNRYAGNLVYAQIPMLVNLNDTSNSILPFSLKDNYQDWQNKRYDCEPPSGCASPECFICPDVSHHNLMNERQKADSCENFKRFQKKLVQLKSSECEFRVLIPSKISNKVYLVSQKQTSIKELNNIDSNWFDSTYVKDNFTKNLEEWKSYLQHLSIIIANDPEVVFTKRPSNKSLWAIIKGQNNNSKYILGAGFPTDKLNWVTYIPVDISKGGLRISRQIMNSLRDDPRVRQMIEERFTKNKKTAILEALPAVWAANDDPLKAVGGSSNKIDFYNSLSPILQTNSELNLLVNGDSAKLFVWSANEKTELKKLSNYYYQPLIEMQSFLIIADPKLAEFTIDADNGKWLFFFKNKLDLWSWIKSDKSFKQHSLLPSNTVLSFTENDCTEYLKALKQKAGPDEQKFFLEYAENPSGFDLCDIFIVEKDFRIILYKKTAEASSKFDVLNRMSNSENAISYAPFKLFKIEGNNIRQLYNVEWKIQTLAKKFIVDHIGKDLELWLSKSSMGFFKQNKVSVYLKQCYRVENLMFGKVTENISEIFHLKTAVPINHQLLFTGWLYELWDDKIWRANPLGFLERVN